MKFKSFLLLLTAIYFAAFGAVSCSNDDSEIAETEQNIEFFELPVGAQNLLMDKYEQSDIDVMLRSAEGYNVSVRKIKIDFDKYGEWKKIKSKDKLALSDEILSLIPASIISHINDFYSDRGILEIERKKDKYEVELTGEPEVELEFDLSGNMTGDIKATFANLPENIQSFVKAHFSVETIKKIEKKSKKYQVEFNDKTELEFDTDGNWSKIKTNSKPVPASIIALLPAHLTSYISEHYPAEAIYRIEDKSDKYEIKLGNSVELNFDKVSNEINEDTSDNNDDNDNENTDNDNNGGLISPSALPQSAQDLLAKCYANIATDYVKKEGNRYFVRLVDGTKLEFLLTGEVESVIAPYSGAVAIDALMPSIKKYISENYSGRNVFKYIKQGQQGYMVQMSGYPVDKIFFDLNGNFIRKHF